jgi:hypothetical protein
MPDETAPGLLTEDQVKAIWEEVDQLRDQQDEVSRRLRKLDDLLLADLRARTGFPRGTGEK